MTAKRDKTSPPPKPRFRLRIGWGLAAGAAVIAVASTSLFFATQWETITRLYIRMAPDPHGKLFKAIGSRLNNSPSPEYVRFAAVEFASRAVEDCEQGELTSADALAQISAYAGRAPDNGAFEWLHLGIVLLNDEAHVAERFMGIVPLLDVLRRKPIHFGLAEQRKAWAEQLAFEFGDQSTGALVAFDMCVPAHLAMKRRINDRMLALADGLEADGDDAAAVTCCEAVVDWSRRAAESAIDVDEVWLWADAAIGANARLAAIHQRNGRAEAASAASEAVRRLRTFREALAAKRDAEPINGLANPAAPRRATTTHPRIYESTLTSLLTAGLGGLSAALACIVGLVTTLPFVLASLFIREPTPHCPIGKQTFPALAASGIILIAPLAIFAAGLGFGPLNLDRLIDTDVLTLACLSCTVASFVALLVSTALISRTARPSERSRWLWPLVAVVAFVAFHLAVYATFQQLVSPPSASDDLWATMTGRRQLKLLARVALLAAVLAVLVWTIAYAARWIRAPREWPLPSLQLKTDLKCLAVVSVCWWAIAATAASGTGAYAAASLREFSALTLADARDSIAARMGTQWREAFAGGPSR